MILDRYDNELKPGDKVLFVHKSRIHLGIEFGELTRESDFSFWIKPLNTTKDRRYYSTGELIFNKNSYTNRNGEITYFIIKLTPDLNILALEKYKEMNKILNDI